MVAGNNKVLGAHGENLALERYQNLGFECLDQNWSCSDGEIDLIFCRDQLIVFVEVKLRTSNCFGSAAEAVDWRKQNKVRQVASNWLSESDKYFEDLRFDVATVDGNDQVEIIEACF